MATLFSCIKTIHMSAQSFKKNTWLKARGYLHFTNKKMNLAPLEKRIKDPAFVAKYAFFPLLKKNIVTRRYKKMAYDEHGKPIRKHFNAEKKESNRKIRPIEYATHLDSMIFAYYAQEILLPQYEKKLQLTNGLSDCITAYRKIKVEPNKDACKSSIHFAAEVFEHIQQKGTCVALAFDVESFFPSLDHEILKAAWKNLFDKTLLEADHFKVFKASTRYAYIDRDDLRVPSEKRQKRKMGFDESYLDKLRQQNIHAFFESPKAFRDAIKNGAVNIRVNRAQKGIPHGLPISSVLANLYLLDFDTTVLDKIVKPFNAFYRRYSDDIIIVCESTDYKAVIQLIVSAIETYKLKISESKTEICFFNFNEQTNRLEVSRNITTKAGKIISKPNMPLVYLGFEFYGHKTLIKSASIAKFYRRMKKAIRRKCRHAAKAALNQNKEEVFLLKRKLKRLFTHHGATKRSIKTKQVSYKKVGTRFKPQTESKDKDYLGNTLTYAYRAAKIMKVPAIKRQYRRHFSIFQKTIEKYEQIT